MCMQMTPLKWQAASSGQDSDGRWACAATQHSYPSVHQSLLHPCTSTEGGCCGNSNHTRLLLRFQSFFYEDNARLLLAYEVSFSQHIYPSPAQHRQACTRPEQCCQTCRCMHLHHFYR